jgi:hypothetical protein
MLLCCDRKSTSSASPKEWAGSVDMINTFQSSAEEEANSTARAEDIDVLPTPPLPPTNITGVLLLLLFLLSSIIDEISSTNGCNECSRVDDEQNENVGKEDEDGDRHPRRLAVSKLHQLLEWTLPGGNRGTAKDDGAFLAMLFTYAEHVVDNDRDVSSSSSESAAGDVLALDMT